MKTVPLTSARIREYIADNPVAVVSTINPDGSPAGAPVYVCMASHNVAFFVTKSFTQKYKNCLERPGVCLTLYNEAQSSTLQINGIAHVSHDPALIDQVLHKLSAIHAAQAEWLPPLAKLRAGAYQIIGIQIQKARLAEYRGMDIGGADIFSEAVFDIK